MVSFFKFILEPSNCSKNLILSICESPRKATWFIFYYSKLKRELINPQCSKKENILVISVTQIPIN